MQTESGRALVESLANNVDKDDNHRTTTLGAAPDPLSPSTGWLDPNAPHGDGDDGDDHH